MEISKANKRFSDGDIKAALDRPPLGPQDGELFERLTRLIDLAAQAAGKDTAWQGIYDPAARGPLHGHCGVLAYVLKEAAGGTVVKCMAVFGSGAERTEEFHVFNLIPDDRGELRKFDGSASQYGRPVGHPPAEIHSVELDTPEIDPTLGGRLNLLCGRMGRVAAGMDDQLRF